MTSRDEAMTDLRETVSAAILQVMREDGQFGTLAFADAAIAAMQPAIEQARREALEDALEVCKWPHELEIRTGFSRGMQIGCGIIREGIEELIEKEKGNETR